jgi:hypothetical protein
MISGFSSPAIPQSKILVHKLSLIELQPGSLAASISASSNRAVEYTLPISRSRTLSGAT